MTKTPLRRGDVIVFDFGSKNGCVQAGIRPALVLQRDNLNNSSPTTIIAPITTELKRLDLFSHLILGKCYGLHECSMVLLEQIRTVNQDKIIACIGHVNEQKMSQVDRCLCYTLGINVNAFHNPSHQGGAE